VHRQLGGVATGGEKWRGQSATARFLLKCGGAVTQFLQKEQEGVQTGGAAGAAGAKEVGLAIGLEKGVLSPPPGVLLRSSNIESSPLRARQALR